MIETLVWGFLAGIGMYILNDLSYSLSKIAKELTGINYSLEQTRKKD